MCIQFDKIENWYSCSPYNLTIRSHICTFLYDHINRNVLGNILPGLFQAPEALSKEVLLEAKQLGFADKQIAQAIER